MLSAVLYLKVFYESLTAESEEDGIVQTDFNVSGVILAAGKSTRMGQDKLLLPFKGKPIVEHVIAAARNSLLREVIVVVPCGYDISCLDMCDCKVVTSPNREMGQAESVKAGLAAIAEGSKGCAVMLGDLPLLTSHSINRLLQTFAIQPEKWVIPMSKGKRGNPVIIPARWFEEVSNLSGDAGARQLFSRPEALLHFMEADDAGFYFDIDTVEQYQKLLSHYEEEFTAVNK